MCDKYKMCDICVRKSMKQTSFVLLSRVYEQYYTVHISSCVGFVAAAVSMPMGGCRARSFDVSSLPILAVDVVMAAALAVL